MSRILIVDDDSDLAGVVGDALEALEFVVAHAANGVQARTHLRSREYDLVVMDWDLPDASGVELCQEVRSRGDDTPIIMLTGKQELEDKVTGLDAGADDYLTKPFAIKELISRIKSLLRRSRAGAASGAGGMELVPDAVIAGKYRLGEIIGAGGFGQVWRAMHLDTGRKVVVKLLHAALSADTESLKRFEQECQVMSAISHPNVVSVIDVGTLPSQQPYMVLEYVEGESLRQRISRCEQLEPEETLEILIQVCRGVQEAHNAGVIHRDLKPANVLLKERTDHPDWVKITDFGVARLAHSQERITQDSSIIGTAEYVAPEQAQAMPLDHRVDLYALGVMFFEMLVGEVPFCAETPIGTLMQHVYAPIPRLCDHRRELSPGSSLDQILAKAMAKEPDKRYQSADEMRIALESALKGLKSFWGRWIR